MGSVWSFFPVVSHLHLSPARLHTKGHQVIGGRHGKTLTGAGLPNNFTSHHSNGLWVLFKNMERTWRQWWNTTLLPSNGPSQFSPKAQFANLTLVLLVRKMGILLTGSSRNAAPGFSSGVTEASFQWLLWKKIKLEGKGSKEKLGGKRVIDQLPVWSRSLGNLIL